MVHSGCTHGISTSHAGVGPEKITVRRWGSIPPFLLILPFWVSPPSWKIFSQPLKCPLITLHKMHIIQIPNQFRIFSWDITKIWFFRSELQNIQQSLVTGEQEKVQLMKSLACLKEDLTRLEVTDGSMDVPPISQVQFWCRKGWKVLSSKDR